MTETYSVVFRGDILPGHALPDVKTRMAKLFKLDDARLAAVFSGKPVVLKKDCDLATAEKLKSVLTQTGADVEIKPAQATAPAPVQPPQPPVPPAAPPSPGTGAAAVPARPAVAPAAGRTIEPGSDGLKVAPVGMVMTEAERAAMRKPPVQVDTSHLSLEKRTSSFGVGEEPQVIGRPEIQAPDFGIATVGSDLLKPEEKAVWQPLELDLSAIQLAEPGATLSQDHGGQSVPDVKPLEASLAPAGADLGQIPKPDAPPPPSTDHLKLA